MAADRSSEQAAKSTSLLEHAPSSSRIIELATRIAPFGDLASDLPLLSRTFHQQREDEIARAKVDPSRLTFADHAFATAPLLRALASGPIANPVALALKADAPSTQLAPASSVRRENGLLIYDLFLDAPQDWDLARLRREATPRLVELPWRTRRRELPRVGPPPHHLDLPDDGLVAAHLEHWVHLLWLAPLLVAGRRKNVVGKDARVHPSAFVEGSIIGPGARIGAGAYVRHSYVGAGSHLSDFTKVSWSVLGDGTHTLVDASFSHVVALGGGTLASLLLRDTLLGRNVFLTSGVIFWSEPLEGTVQVEHRGELADTGRKSLGGCAGHGCVLGARTIVAPGRALPNQTTVVMRKEEGVQRVEDADPGTPMCWFDAALIPAARLGYSGPAE